MAHALHQIFAVGMGPGQSAGAMSSVDWRGDLCCFAATSLSGKTLEGCRKRETIATCSYTHPFHIRCRELSATCQQGSQLESINPISLSPDQTPSPKPLKPGGENLDQTPPCSQTAGLAVFSVSGLQGFTPRCRKELCALSNCKPEPLNPAKKAVRAWPRCAWRSAKLLLSSPSSDASCYSMSV